MTPSPATTTEATCRVLVIDDEPEVLNAIYRQLRREFAVFLAQEPGEALAILREHPIEVVISDERMPGVAGSEFFSRIREEYPNAIRLLLTGHADLRAVIQAVNQGHIYRYITKPWDATELRAIIREAHERYRLALRTEQLLKELQTANESLEQRVRERTSQLEHALQELRDSEQRFRRIVENINDPVMVTDRHARIHSVNPAFTRVTGYQPGEVLDRTPKLLASGRHPPEFYADLWRRLHEHGYWRGNIWNRRKNGEIYVQRLTISTLRDNPAEGLYIAVYNDISAEIEELERAQFQAQHDALTGLPNRMLLFDRLAEALRDARRQGGKVGVLFIDMDGFKPINDRHGHEAGDAVLQAVARRLERGVRDTDTVARLGGDEFVVVLRQVGLPEYAAQVAEKLLGSLREPVRHGALNLYPNASIGIALGPGDGDDAGGLLQRADAAMYAVKRQGGHACLLHGGYPDGLAGDQSPSGGEIR